MTAKMTRELPKTVAKENRKRKASRPTRSLGRASRNSERSGSGVVVPPLVPTLEGVLKVVAFRTTSVLVGRPLK